MNIKYLLLGAAVCLGLTYCSHDAPLPAGTMKADDPEAAALFQEAKTLREQGNETKARKRLEELAEDHPLAEEAPEALLYIGDIRMQEGEPVDAYEAYDKMLKNYPNSSLYSTGMGRLENLAFGAADGKITYDLLWMFSTSVDTSKVVEMLTSVHDHAPYAASAPKALLKIGEVYERVGGSLNDKAVEFYHKVVDNYPHSSSAPYAQYAIGRDFLNRMESGSRNKSHLLAAQDAFDDFLQRYPKHELAGKAKKDLDDVHYRLATMSLDIARFYDKSGNRASAIYYYQEAAHNPYNGEVRAQATSDLQSMGVPLQDPRKGSKGASSGKNIMN